MRQPTRAGMVIALLILTSAVLGVSRASAESVGADCVTPVDLVSWPQDLSNCNLKGVTIGSNFALRVSNLSGANLKDATISGGFALEMSNLQGANLSGATISGFLAMGGPNPVNTSNLSGANLSGATISGFAALAGIGTNLTNANLNRAVVTGAFALDGAVYGNTTCPDGTNSDDNAGTCIGHLTP